MKIGILIDRHNVGGVEKIAIEQVSALRSLGVDAYLILLTKKARVKDAFSDLRKGIPEIYLDERLPKFLRFSFKFPIFHFFSFFHISYPFLLPFVIKRREFDYIIAHGTFTSFSAIAFKLFNKISFSSFIWDPIGYIIERVYKNKFSKILFYPLKGIAKFLDTLIVKQSDEILVGGKAHNQYFKKINPNVKISIVAPSVHPIRNIKIKKSNYILMLTAWKKGKNPEYILELVKKLPKIKIKMVGKWLDKDYKEYFTELVKNGNLEQNIDIHGSATEKELSLFYKKALFFLQTNDDRGFGMPAMEAAAHGTTFIIPKGQGVCELFKNKKHGFFTKELDTKKIIKLIELLEKNPNQAIKMGKLAHQEIVSKHSWQKHAEKLTVVIKRNLRKK